MSPWVTVAEVLDFLSSRQRFGIRPGLLRTMHLLDALANPDRSLHFVHVAGTNGKGSTCAFLSSILQRAGYRVGQYISPSLTHYAERMSVNGERIGEQDLVLCANQVKAVIETLSDDEEIQPTEFEVSTVMALLYFKKQNVDVVVWETGLGGRYDATNVVTPDVSVITNVALDHTKILGDRVEQIAWDKAGIIKENVPIVTGASGASLDVISRVASDKASALYRSMYDFRWAIEDAFTLESLQRFTFFGRHRDFYGLQMSLLGPHQAQNAATALATIECLQEVGYQISDESVREGLRSTKWPGRMEIVAHDPKILLDGAHNPAGAKALKMGLLSIGTMRYVLVLGVLKDKDVAGILEEILPGACYVVATEPPHTARKLPHDTLASWITDRVGHRGIHVDCAAFVEDALLLAKQWVSTHQATDTIVVSGSLYTIAEARRVVM